MILFEEINRIQSLHQLILFQNTGTPEELASYLHISRRQLYNVLGELKDLGAEIEYSRNRYTFYYENNFNLNISVKVSVLNNVENNIISGGFFSPCNFCARNLSIFVSVKETGSIT